MRILIASKNQHKIEEFVEMFNNLNIDCISILDLPEIEEPKETGITFEENALIKAKYYYEHYKIPCLADDTGLCVDVLNGLPGVYSARYAGESQNSAENRKLLIKNLEGNFPAKSHFYTYLVFYDGKKTITACGNLDGEIISEARGEYGFGYDSIFFLPNLNKTLAEIELSKKNKISHRHNALTKIKPLIENYLKQNEIEETIINLLKTLYPLKTLKIIKRFEGGMSNYTYKVKVGNDFKVVRVPGEGADKYVNRKDEFNSLNMLSDDFELSKYEYFDLKSGIKISKYIEGKCMNEITNYLDYDKVYAEMLKKLHKLGPILDHDYLPFQRLKDYEKQLNEFKHCYDSVYLKLRSLLNRYKTLLEGRPLTFCHCDAQSANCILMEDQQMVLLDFEFSSNNDPFYDIACYGNDDINLAFRILNAYLGRNATLDEIKIVRLWFIYQCLQWYNVAWLKHLDGMSEKLKLDFSDIASWFLKMGLITAEEGNL